MSIRSVRPFVCLMIQISSLRELILQLESRKQSQNIRTQDWNKEFRFLFPMYSRCQTTAPLPGRSYKCPPRILSRYPISQWIPDLHNATHQVVRGLWITLLSPHLPRCRVQKMVSGNPMVISLRNKSLWIINGVEKWDVQIQSVCNPKATQVDLSDYLFKGPRRKRRRAGFAGWSKKCSAVNMDTKQHHRVHTYLHVQYCIWYSSYVESRFLNLTICHNHATGRMYSLKNLNLLNC